MGACAQRVACPLSCLAIFKIPRFRETESASHKRERAKRSTARKILRVATELLVNHHGETISTEVQNFLATSTESEADSMSLNAWPPASVSSKESLPAQKEVGPLVQSLIKAADRISTEQTPAVEQPAGSDLLDLSDLAEPACLTASEIESLFNISSPPAAPQEPEVIPVPRVDVYRIDSDEEIADSELLEATIIAEQAHSERLEEGKRPREIDPLIAHDDWALALSTGGVTPDVKRQASEVAKLACAAGSFSTPQKPCGFGRSSLNSPTLGPMATAPLAWQAWNANKPSPSGRRAATPIGKAKGKGKDKSKEWVAVKGGWIQQPAGSPEISLGEATAGTGSAQALTPGGVAMRLDPDVKPDLLAGAPVLAAMSAACARANSLTPRTSSRRTPPSATAPSSAASSGKKELTDLSGKTRVKEIPKPLPQQS